MRAWVIGMAMLLPVSAFAAGCEEYPMQEGVDPASLVSAGKVMATASVAVNFDDVTAINAARRSATLIAKGLIADFLTNNVKREETLSNAVEQSATLKGEEKEAVLETLAKQADAWSANSQALLRGVITIGDCYSKAREFRVTVGLKPETQQRAEEIANTTRGSIQSAPTPTVSNTQPAPGGSTNAPASRGRPLDGVEGFSNTQGLTKF